MMTRHGDSVIMTRPSIENHITFVSVSKHAEQVRNMG